MPSRRGGRKTGRPGSRTAPEASHQLGLHHGEALFVLSNTYNTLLLTIVEGVQNALDANATAVFVGVNRQRSEVVVLDDGEGVTQDKFQEALLSVGRGIKKPGSLGRFGLGLISPLNKCQRFTFTSFPLNGYAANRWEFVGEKIRKQHTRVDIPFKELAALPSVPAHFALANTLGAEWRTMVYLHGVTQDRTIGTVEVNELAGHIRTKLGRAMRQKGTRVHVVIYDEKGQEAAETIDPVEFTGEKLAVVTYVEELCGKVVFELYRAPKTGGARNGQVSVMQLGDNYPIGWREFYTQALGSRWLAEASLAEAFAALGSGFFEGTVYAEHIELAPERTKFVLNDALRSCYIAIYRWFEEHGRALFEDEQETRREERYQQLGKKSLDRLYALLDGADFAGIEPLLEATAPATAVPTPSSEEESTGKGSGTGGQGPGGGNGRRGRRRVVAQHSEEEASSQDESNEGPRSKPKRQMLSFGYEAMPHSPHLWEFDPERATLTFNIIHPIWVRCDEGEHGKRTKKHDKQVMRLQEWVALELLMLLTKHPDPADLDHVRSFIDERTKPFVAAAILNW